MNGSLYGDSSSISGLKTSPSVTLEVVHGGSHGHHNNHNSIHHGSHHTTIHHHSPPSQPLHIPAKRPQQQQQQQQQQHQHQQVWGTSSSSPPSGLGGSYNLDASGFLSSEPGASNNNTSANGGVSYNGRSDHNGGGGGGGSVGSSASVITSTPSVNNSSTSPLTSSSSSSAAAAAAAMAATAYAPSHYPSLNSSADLGHRRLHVAAPTASAAALPVADTKPVPGGLVTSPSSTPVSSSAASTLPFWQNDYHKYSSSTTGGGSNVGAGSTGGGTGTMGSSPVGAAATAAECQAAAAAAAFSHHHQAAASWNYPHPGNYGLTTSPADEARARHAAAMTADAASFHTDYSRLQYPPEGIYAHPPGTLEKIPYTCDLNTSHTQLYIFYFLRDPLFFLLTKAFLCLFLRNVYCLSLAIFLVILQPPLLPLVCRTCQGLFV